MWFMNSSNQFSYKFKDLKRRYDFRNVFAIQTSSSFKSNGDSGQYRAFYMFDEDINFLTQKPICSEIVIKMTSVTVDELMHHAC